MTNTTACLYLRQSKARDDSISLELQEAAGRDYCRRQGYQVGRVVVDEGVSGFREWQKRPNFPIVLNGPEDVVVVYRWSRLSRRHLDQAVLIDLLDKAGKRVESAIEPTDPSTAGGRLSRNQMLLIANYESDVKSEMFKEAQARRLAAGLPSGGAPRFGYRKNDKKTYEPDPVTGPVLRDLYLRYTAGAGFQQLCKWLNVEGHTTTKGSPWIVQSLLRAMDSGFGAGLLVQDRRAGDVAWLRGAHDAVVTDEEWAAYREARARRRIEPPKRRTATWHLAGLAVCGRCGSRLVVTTFKSEKSQALCSAYHQGKGCVGVWMKRQQLEREVAVWLGGRIDRLAAELPQRDSERAAAQKARDDAQRGLDEAVRALGQLAASHARGLLDDDGYRGAQAELLGERSVAEKTLAAAREELARLVPPEDAYEALERSPEMTPGEFGTLIGRVLRRVEVTKAWLTFVPVVGDPEVFPR